MNSTHGLVYDQWCEQAMWTELTGVPQSIEYTAALTGLLICFVPFTSLCCWHRPTYGLVLLGVSFLLLGVGTFLFHWFPKDPLFIPLDWFPMTITMTIVILLHVWLINEQDLCAQLIFSTLFIVWFFTLIFTVTTDTFPYDYMSIVLVLVPVLTFLFHNIFVSKYLPGDITTEIAQIWALLIFSLVLWLLNQNLCKQYHWMALFHSVYHITIALAIWWASIIADLSIVNHYHLLPPVS